MFAIHSKLLGNKNKKHLLVQDIEHVQWIDRCPDDVFFLTGYRKLDRQCLDALLKLNDLDFVVQPPQRFVTMMNRLTKSTNIPWQQVMNERDYLSFVKSLVAQTNDAYLTCSKEYYGGTWAHGNVVLNALQPAKIDTAFYEQHELTAHPAFKTFEPDKNGFAKVTGYDRLATRTGRLTRVSGADFLTLKKDLRHVVTSRFGVDGKIIYVDFSGIEIRTLFYEADVKLSSGDIYTELSNSFFDSKLDRDKLKTIIISAIYGQNEFALAGQLELSLEETRSFIRAISTLLKKDTLLMRLKKEYLDSQTIYIKNKYGRHVKIDNPIDRVFINSYAQSTSVDVALMGFSKIVQELCSDKAVPIGVIHDGFLIDCHKDEFDKFPETMMIDIMGFEQQFVIKRTFE